MAANAELFEFQAETKQLLDIVVHSLYTSKEIFLRELISNASDAIDRLRFEALTNPLLLDDDSDFKISLETDGKERTLTLTDNGIGMSREEVIANIGTIARSGTRELRERMKEGESSQALAALIGQFGVGFYSCFMVAERVALITRRAGETVATRWESKGDGSYILQEAEKPDRGTSIKLYLKSADPENGIEDYTDRWILSRIIKRYSDFVSYPIIFRGAKDETEAGPAEQNSAGESEIEETILNSMKPIWTRPQTEVSQSDYAEFYRHISHDWSEPLETISLKAEGRFEYQALLFIPSKAPYDLFYHAGEHGLRLYAKKVIIMEKCADLLPAYLRFIKGMVDSADLPLNISRQMLQQDRHIAQIRKWLTKKVLDCLEEMRKKDYEKYLTFWGQFGRAIKEGVSSDHDNKERLVPLLLFQSSNHPEELTSLQDYVARLKEDQQEIYFITGETRKVLENAPHLELFKQKGYEVLYLVDPVDELLVQYLTEYDGKKLKPVGKGRIKLEEENFNELKAKEEENSALLQFLQRELDEHVKQVRLTNRLITSPVCLIVEEHDYSPQLERLLQKGKGGGPKQRRILELNPQHEIFLKMKERFSTSGEDEVLKKYGELLFGYALLAEGSEIPDPVKFNSLLSELMAQSLSTHSQGEG